MMFWLLGQLPRLVALRDVRRSRRFAAALPHCRWFSWQPSTFFFQLGDSPRSVVILDCILIVGMLGAVRASWRMFREVFRPTAQRQGCRWALLVGTDLSNGILAHQIQSHLHLPYRVRGCSPPNEANNGARLGQIPILGRVEDVGEIAGRPIASPTCWWSPARWPGQRLRGLMEACEQNGLNLRIIRSLEDRLQGEAAFPSATSKSATSWDATR